MPLLESYDNVEYGEQRREAKAARIKRCYKIMCLLGLDTKAAHEFEFRWLISN